MAPALARRSFLLGALGGVAVGSAAGLLVRRVPASPAPLVIPGTDSYAQQGEDLIVAEIFKKHLGIARPSYADIGAHEPIFDNNTYYFYERGSRGLLVEPNPFYADKLREARPGDAVLEAGIGPTGKDTVADYYVFRGDGQLNTFSKAQADAVLARHGAQALDHVAQVRLVNVNEALADHFPAGGPDFLSIDTEGLDLDILRSLDFGRFRPKVVCAETSKMDGTVDGDILALMESRGYAVRGGTFVNTVFVDGQALARAQAPAGVAAP
jgi:FkbM family methyltransferase